MTLAFGRPFSAAWVKPSTQPSTAFLLPYVSLKSIPCIVFKDSYYNLQCKQLIMIAVNVLLSRIV